jgi:hypothetical protein
VRGGNVEIVERTVDIHIGRLRNKGRAAVVSLIHPERFEETYWFFDETVAK